MIIEPCKVHDLITEEQVLDNKHELISLEEKLKINYES